VAQLKEQDMPSIFRIALAVVVALVCAGPVAAQQRSTVTQADISRLQDNVYLAERDLTQTRGRDAAGASQLQTELDDLRDEVIYLKVKLRKEQTLARSEYADVRDRIDDLRSRARGETATAVAAPAPAPRPVAAPRAPVAVAPASPAPRTATAGVIEIPSGTEIDVRLQNTLNSGTAVVEDRFEGTTLTDLGVNGQLAIPAGAVVRGVVTGVERATRTNRTARMTLSFDQVTVRGRSYPIRGTVTQAIEGEGIRGETGRTAAGAGVGAIIGGILGGFKGALAGVLIGGGGTIAATDGKEVELPQGSVLRVRLDSPLDVQPTR
jgi:hypothetical protein